MSKIFGILAFVFLAQTALAQDFIVMPQRFNSQNTYRGASFAVHFELLNQEADNVGLYRITSNSNGRVNFCNQKIMISGDYAAIMSNACNDGSICHGFGSYINGILQVQYTCSTVTGVFTQRANLNDSFITPTGNGSIGVIPVRR